MRHLRLFSHLPTRLSFPVKMTVVPPAMAYQLKEKFTLAEHFISTFHENNSHDWRKTQHQLLLAETQSEPIAIAGMETGEGDIIQRYLCTNNEELFQNKTILLHILEVLPTYRGHGLQMLLWKTICERALENNTHSILWNPSEHQNYRGFFNKFDLIPKQYLLSQMIHHGEYFDGDSTQNICEERVIRIFQIEQKDLEKLLKKLEIAMCELSINNPTHQLTDTRQCKL